MIDNMARVRARKSACKIVLESVGISFPGFVDRDASRELSDDCSYSFPEEIQVMKARVDPDLCIGCGICPDVAPKIFTMGTDDKAHTLVDPVPEELQAACKDAADQCPQAAIEVE